MGITIFVIGAAVLNLALFIGIIIGALMIIDRTARPAAGAHAHVIVLGLGGAAIVTSLIVGMQLKSGGSTLSEHNWEQQYCDSNVGEQIYRTVDDVRGVHFAPPRIVHGGGRFHEKDADHRSYLERPERLYEVFEVRRKANELVEHYERIDEKTVTSRKNTPTVRYAFTWSPISTRQETQAGVHGQELEVFDRETGEVLGRRVLYYYDPPNRTQPPGYPVPVCPQSKVAQDSTYIDGQPRDSYQFVSKILKPPVPTIAEQARLFDLSLNGGNKRKKCRPIIFIGPGIKPADIVYERHGKDLYIYIQATGESVSCVDFLFSTHFSGKFAPLRFSDGDLIPGNEYREKIFPPLGR